MTKHPVKPMLQPLGLRTGGQPSPSPGACSGCVTRRYPTPAETGYMSLWDLDTRINTAAVHAHTILSTAAQPSPARLAALRCGSHISFDTVPP